MQTIINQSLSDMLDKLLNKALEEKPKIEKTIYFDFFSLSKLTIIRDNDYTNKIEITIYIPYIYGCSIDNFLMKYAGDLTPHQKAMIDKIFEKWSNDNGK